MRNVGAVSSCTWKIQEPVWGLGGRPIRRDKTFIFGSYEGFRQRLALSTDYYWPER
jgi:hypothetical protein